MTAYYAKVKVDHNKYNILKIGINDINEEKFTLNEFPNLGLIDFGVWSVFLMDKNIIIFDEYDHILSWKEMNEIMIRGLEAVEEEEKNPPID